MNFNILVTASALSDQDLLARLETLAGKEREASVELVAHLAALDGRPALFLAQGHGSLFSYCTQALRLSEDAACNRIEAARACRRFPLILELLASGSLTLTSVRLLAKHLTEENHQSVLAKAEDRSRREIEVLIAELAPRADIPSTVRRLPTARPSPSTEASAAMTNMPSTAGTAPVPSPTAATAIGPSSSAAGTAIDPSPTALPATPRPIVQAWAPERYRVQFTIGQETHEKLRRLQELLRRQIPNGDPGAIFDRALTVLLAKVEKTKLGAADKPRTSQPVHPGTSPSGSIRSGTDKEGRKPTVRSRHIPREVQRAVWRRDAGQCAFMSPAGRRCAERTFLELHHRQPYAMHGPSTIANISLRCWRHNQYEAALIFGPLVYSAILSLYSWSLTQLDSAKPFAGFHNYHRLLSDAELGTALRNTFVFVAGSVSVELILGFALALALYHIGRGRKLANAIILLPMITTPVIVALIWSFLLDPQFGSRSVNGQRPKKLTRLETQ